MEAAQARTKQANLPIIWHIGIPTSYDTFVLLSGVLALTLYNFDRIQSAEIMQKRDFEIIGYFYKSVLTIECA